MGIIIGADLIPTESNVELFVKGNIEELFGDELLSVLGEADYRIINLEAPLVDSLSPICKCGPNLSAPSSAVETYKKLQIDLASIANNHIMDQGVNGLISTIETLQKAGIAYVGAGANLEKANQAFFFNFQGKKIAVYSCVEHEFSVATQDEGGANPMDVLNSFDVVSEIKVKCDYLILLYHGGKEYYRYPSPKLQMTCRKFVEKGADIVICQHSHCIGCEEKYLNKTILYGQGNFLFDRGNSEYRNNGVLVKIDNDFRIGYIPIIRKNNTVRLAQGECSSKILDDLMMRSKELQKEGFVEKQYDCFAAETLDHYLEILNGDKRKVFVLRAINKLTGGRLFRHINKKVYHEAALLAILNSIECEAHSELLIRGLKLRINR